MGMRQGSKADAQVDDRARRDDSAFDLFDVPAAVVCAACGNPDCSGCLFEEPTNASGVVAIIPWERPGVGFFTRLWQTSKLATIQSRAFFGTLPDGDLSQALAFALICEAFAVGGLSIAGAAIAIVLLPDLPHLLFTDPTLRANVTRGVVSGILLLVLAMVTLHAAHGAALDFAAKRHGARKRGRGVRFGLYACGWDLVTLPFGLLTLALLEGFNAARQAAPLGLTAPLQSSEAYLIGVRGIAPDHARFVARRAALYAAVPVVTLLVLGALLIAFVWR